MPLSSSSFGIDWTFVDFAGNRELILTDRGQWLNSTDNGGNQNVTIPDPADVGFPIGTNIAFEQVGTSTITLVAGANVTLNSRGGLVISNGQNAVFGIALKSLIAGTATWTAYGDLA